MRNKLAICCFILGLAIAPLDRVKADPPIDVLVALTPETYDENTALIVAELEEAMYNVAFNSGMLSHPATTKLFRFRPYLFPAAFPYGASPTGGQAVSFITSETDPLLNTARNTAAYTVALGADSYDLVVILVEDLRDNEDPENKAICGYGNLAYLEDLIIDPLHSDAKNDLYGIALSNTVGCRNNFSIVVGHELGHTLGLDHQLTGPIAHDTDDSQPTVPVTNFGSAVPDNHPMVHYQPSGVPLVSTIMVGKISYFGPHTQYSDSDAVFTIDATKAAGSSAASNRRILDLTWDDVSAYRPLPPPPPSCSLTWAFNGCNSAYPYTVTASLPGYTVTNMDVDYQNGTSGPWYGLWNGIFTCPGFNTSYLRTLLATLITAYGTSQCTTIVYPQNCDDPGGGGGPAW